MTKTERVQCFNCNHFFETSDIEASKLGDKTYCDDCTFTCENCEERGYINDSYDTTNGRVCASCFEEYRECAGCNEYLHRNSNRWMNGSSGFCEMCRDESEREYTESKELLDQNPGKIIKSARPFGIEVETLTGNDDADIDERIGYCEDGSIDGDGIEYQLPPVSGKKGENFITSFCKVINEAGNDVNESCGYHVHLDAADFKDDDYKIRKLWLTYLAYEDVIMSFLPQSRTCNNYCYQLRKDYQFTEIEDADSIKELEEIWYRVKETDERERRKGNKKDSSRYHGVNLHTLLSQGNLEIRYHSGTMNAKKILEWANLHAMIMDTIAKGEGKTCPELLEIMSSTSMEYKTNSLFKWIGLSETSQDYFKARQSIFYRPPRYKNTEEFEKNVELINSETE